jgi:hypothetical protein
MNLIGCICKVCQFFHEKTNKQHARIPHMSVLPTVAEHNETIRLFEMLVSFEEAKIKQEQ